MITITAQELRALGPIVVGQGQGGNASAEEVEADATRRHRALTRLAEFLVGLQAFIAMHVRAAKGAVRAHLKKTVRDLEGSIGA